MSFWGGVGKISISLAKFRHIKEYFWGKKLLKLRSNGHILQDEKVKNNLPMLLACPPPVVQYEFHYIWWDERSGGVVIFRENLLKPPSNISCDNNITTLRGVSSSLHHPPTLIRRLSRILFPFWRMKEGLRLCLLAFSLNIVFNKI